MNQPEGAPEAQAGSISLTDRVREAFMPAGLLSCTVDAFSARPGQTRMAMAVARTIQDGGVLVVEAGTGVGKTFSYLVPALLSGERVLLSTATKTLQDQLAGRDLPRLAQLGITASVQPIHATDDMDTADLFLRERGAHMYNFRTLFATGALVAFGSDAPVSDPNPFLGFHAALTRQRPERMGQAGPWYADERISLEQTIFAYTLGAAKAAGWDKVIGSLTPGKLADLIVVDRDLFELEKQGIKGTEVADTEVEMTIFGGEIVYKR